MEEEFLCMQLFEGQEQTPCLNVIEVKPLVTLIWDNDIFIIQNHTILCVFISDCCFYFITSCMSITLLSFLSNCQLCVLCIFISGNGSFLFRD